MRKLGLLTMTVLGGCVTTGSVETDTAFVDRNTTSMFHHASELSRDCSVLSIPEITVTSPPSHGKVEIVRTKLRPNGFGPQNPRYKCRTRLVDGVEARYTPEQGFIGEDRTTIRIGFHFGNGEVRKDHYVDVTTILKVQ